MGLIEADNKKTEDTQSSYKFLYIVSSFYVSILIISNIASSAKIVDTGLSIFSNQLVFDGGTLLFPFAYILGDVLTEVYGYKVSRNVIWTGFSILALTALMFFLLGILPAESSWEETAGTAAYNNILGGITYGGIIIASLAAYLAGEFSNSIILSKLKVLMKGKHLWVRTIGSTIVGEFLDTLVFVLIATAFGIFSRELFWSLILTNYIIKCLIEVIMTPLTYKLSSFLKKKEGIDVYDTKIKYLPF